MITWTAPPADIERTAVEATAFVNATASPHSEQLAAAGYRMTLPGALGLGAVWTAEVGRPADTRSWSLAEQARRPEGSADALREQLQQLQVQRRELLATQRRRSLDDSEARRLALLQWQTARALEALHPVDLSLLDELIAERRKQTAEVRATLAQLRELLAPRGKRRK